MINKQDLQQAIEQCERAPMTYQNFEKLATFYAIYDRIYAERASKTEKAAETKVSVSGNSEFFRSINGLPANSVWSIMEELMETIQITNPRLYDGVMQKIEDL